MVATNSGGETAPATKWLDKFSTPPSPTRYAFDFALFSLTYNNLFIGYNGLTAMKAITAARVAPPLPLSLSRNL